eukprot:SM000003S11218  [mRNA]  locus=s3:1673326:1679568:+ [translate_table: standard]
MVDMADSRRVSLSASVPQHAFYAVGRILRLLAVYGAYHYLAATHASAVILTFWCLLGSAVIFVLLQRPWAGRTLPNSTWVPTILNGAIMALSLLFFFIALRNSGPIRTLLAEYSGAVIAAASTMLFGRRTSRKYKVYGLVAMLAAFLLLSQGWTTTSPLWFYIQGHGITLLELCSGAWFMSRILACCVSCTLCFLHSKIVPLDSTTPRANVEQADMAAQGLRGSTTIPVLAGLLSALRRLLARRAAHKTKAKKRLHAVTVASAAVFMLPLSIVQLATGASQEQLPYEGSFARVYLGMVIFGLVLSFYIEIFAEERLALGPASLKHLVVTVAGAFVLELVYQTTFFPPGFLLVSALLGIGLYWATVIDRPKKTLEDAGLPSSDNGKESRRTAALPRLFQGPLEHLLSDQKSKKIALFLLLNTSFMFVEFTYGFLVNSLGLVSDACHMLFDCAALAIGLYASYIARLEAPSKYAYGMLDPPEISADNLLVVSIGGLLVNVVGLVFFHEAHHHAHGAESCSHSHSHSHSPAAVTADHTDILESHFLSEPNKQSSEVGRGFEVYKHYPLQHTGDIHKHSRQAQSAHHHHQHGDHTHNVELHDSNHGADTHRHVHSHKHELQEALTSGNPHMDHNMHGIFLHILADTLGSVGVVISTLLIKYKGWMLTDPACSILISILIVSTVIPLLRNSAEIILQRVPRAVEPAIQDTLDKVGHLEGVTGQQRPQFWSFTPKLLVGSLHVLVVRGADKQSIRRSVLDLFHSIGVANMSVQVEEDSMVHTSFFEGGTALVQSPS